MSNQINPSLFVTAAKGTENALESELRAHGFDIQKTTSGGVHIRAQSDQDFMKVNLITRIGLRVLVKLADSHVKNKADLYKAARKIAWEKIFSVDQTFSIRSHIHSTFTTHSNYPSLVVKDAIADRFRNLLNQRPNVAKSDADISIVVHIKKQDASIYLDSTGFSLHKRGYRKKRTEAPLMETLAATMIRLSGWDGTRPFYDLMCGSGTIGIEAALVGLNEYPGTWSQPFSFLNWLNYDESSYDDLLDSFDQDESPDVQIFMNDQSVDALNVAKENADRADVEESMVFTHKNILDYYPKSDHGIMILNPPYGVRLEEKDKMQSFFTKLNRHLKENWTGFRVCILTPEEAHLREIKMKPAKVYSLFNGDLPCKYGIFDIH